ncbi:MAG: DUF1933 domain-containing protein [Nitrospiraceae bacterium]|nr:MAG: DUF1933 domain-containing protein [Nitrospiraceae bacterium]
MNLFVIAWQFPKEHHSRILKELGRMTGIYPQLDPETLWSLDDAEIPVFAASMHTSEYASTPRRYVAHKSGEVVFYSGLPINPNAKYAAHHAESLSSHWNQLTEDLEGMYCIVRIHDRPSKLELITDITGMEQVYCFQKDGSWLISNSVHLITRIVRDPALDPSGIGMFLSSDWVWDDLTLVSGVSVISGGQLWTWTEGRDGPQRQTYYGPSQLADLSQKKFSLTYFKKLSNDMMRVVTGLSWSFDQVNCALTGGRDSRLVSAFFINAGLPVKYYTFGEPSGTDAKIARQIADTFELSYKLISVTSSDVLSHWDDMSRQIVLQGDGMASIDLIPSVLACLEMENDKLHVDVGGTGGEMGKGFYSRPDLDFFLNRFNKEKMRHYLSNIIARNYGGIIRQEAVEVTRKHVNSFVNHYTDAGFAPVDIPDVFFLYSRLRRRRGSNKRVYMQYQDFFTPFITRPFIEAVFSMPAVRRYTEPLHYNLIHLLSRELHSLPLDSSPWESQKCTTHLLDFYGKRISGRFRHGISRIMAFKSKPQKTSNKIHTATDMFDNVSWFKAKRQEVREYCLDQKNSIIWDFVDRASFEKISSQKNNPDGLLGYGTYITLYFRIATLFYYERSLMNNS